jgi:histidinol-phosphate aminotransferase
MEHVLAHLPFNRYPDRHATELRNALADLHDVSPEEVFCANGSNEVLQSLLLAFGGAERRALVFEPTYALHSHIARLTATPVVAEERNADFTIDADRATRAIAAHEPAIVFLCSPNNPTGRAEPPALVEQVARVAPGLVVVDEAYGQFAPWSALSLRDGATGGNGAKGAKGAKSAKSTKGSKALSGLVVVRTFSKTWAMAGIRLGYCIAHPDVVRGCEQVSLPYHLSAATQAAGVAALRFRHEMEARVALVAEERGRLQAALAEFDLESWPSDANFILFRPERPAAEVWQGLIERSVLVRDCSSWEHLEGCLRVTVGTPAENDEFLRALGECLR